MWTPNLTLLTPNIYTSAFYLSHLQITPADTQTCPDKSESESIIIKIKSKSESTAVKSEFKSKIKL